MITHRFGVQFTIEVKQTPQHVAYRSLARHDDAGVMPSLSHSGCVKPGEMGRVESEEHATVGRCPLKLRFVGLPAAADLRRGTNVDFRPTRRGGDRTVNVLVQEETNRCHQTESPVCGPAIIDSSSSAAKAASISSKWS